MNRDEFLKNIEREALLSPEVEAALDAELAAQSEVAEIVRLLPVEEPSLEWQSRVRQQTQTIVKRAKRAALWPVRVAGVSVIAGAACALFVATYIGNLNAPGRVTTEAMLNWHDEAVATSVLPGDGITLEGVSSLPSKPASRNDLFDGGSLPSL